MTFREENLYPYVRRNLRARYPACEGWEIYEKDRWEGYEPDFVVERRRHGETERVVVEVKVTCSVSPSHVSQLNKYAKNLSGRNIKIIGKMLVVPSGADTTKVPHDIDIMYLKAFKCEDNEITWYE